jgi:uncharacterized membrane protein YfcA
METYVWVCLVVFLAAFIQGLTGFGSVLLSLPLLAIFLDVVTVIPLAVLLGLSISVVLLFQLWRHLEWKAVFPLLIGAVFGIPIGVFLLKEFDRDILHLALGIILVSYSACGLFLKLSGARIGEGWAYFFGFLSGCLGGSLGAGGPPVVMYTSLQSWTKDKIKVTLQGFFCASSVIVVLGHALSGVTNLMVLRYYVVSLPLLILGIHSGSYFYGMIAEELYKRMLFGILGVLGLFMISKAV